MAYARRHALRRNAAACPCRTTCYTAPSRWFQPNRRPVRQVVDLASNVARRRDQFLKRHCSEVLRRVGSAQSGGSFQAELPTRRELTELRLTKGDQVRHVPIRQEALIFGQGIELLLVHGH